MVGLESSVKATAFYIDENGEYQEIGDVKEVSFTEERENDKKRLTELEKLYDKEGYTEEVEIKLKKYSKKRFKKLLMSRGIQRNDAEIFASIANERKSGISRNIFGEIMVQAITSQWNIKKEKQDEL